MTTGMTPPAASEDAELVNASLAGNREAFGQIVSRYQALVCSLAYSATGSLSQSEDLAQETFIAAWKHLAELREPAKLRAWLCGIARNLINNSLRTQGREPSHRAESLEDIAEPRSPEPLPVERAISREEAEILWRSLERIPETYREPLVLFYREHQSVEAVAQELGFDRGSGPATAGARAETLAGRSAGVCGRRAGKDRARSGLYGGGGWRAADGRDFGEGGVCRRGGGQGWGWGEKLLFPLAALGGLAAMVGAMLFSWKTAVDETKSPVERRLMVGRGGSRWSFWFFRWQRLFMVCRDLARHPVAMWSGLALLLLANVIVGVVMFYQVMRRRMEIVLEEGTMFDAEWSGPGKETNRKAFRKAVRLTIPFLIMFGFGSIGLPWKQHWIRCAAITAGEAAIIIWFFRRSYRMMSFQTMPGLKATWVPAFLRHPIILLPAIVFGSAILGGGLSLFLNPEGMRASIHHGPFLRNMALCLLAAMAAYAIFAVIYVKKRGVTLGAETAFDRTDGIMPGPATANIVNRIMGNPVLRKTMALTAKLMGPMMVKMYAPVFEQLKLSSEQSTQLKDFILKKNAVNMDKGLALMNRKLDAAQRAAAIEEMKSAREGCDAEIRRLLGEEDYSVFEQFEKSLPDRLILGMFKTKLARTGAALSEEQQEQLLQAVGEARAQYPGARTWAGASRIHPTLRRRSARRASRRLRGRRRSLTGNFPTGRIIS